MRNKNSVRFSKTSTSLILCLSLVLVILSGVIYRALASRLTDIVDTSIELPVPLSAFPKQIGDWHGQDVELSQAVIKIAGNDDYLSRLYTNDRIGQWASVYVAYTARPRTMLGHRPQVCYAGSGWINDSTEKTQITTLYGTKVDCLIHRFHKPAPGSGEIVVLNFYILNGQVTNDEVKFAGISFRSPNIAGNAARYVAQIQISSVVENSVLAAASEMSDLIISYFPDKAESLSSK